MIEKIKINTAELDTNLKMQFLFLAAITLLAVVMRFYMLGEWSFWIDEIFTLGRVRAHYHDFDAMLNNILPAIKWIPLSLILTSGATKLLGTSEWSARLVPALIGMVSIPILYFPIKKMLGSQIGLISVLLLAISPWHLFWSQNARFYTSLMLFYSLALFLLYFGLEQDRLRYILAALLLLYFAMGERLIALFFLPVVVSYILLLLIFRYDKPIGFRWVNVLILLLPFFGFLLYDAYNYLTGNPSMIQIDGEYFLGRSNHSPIRLLLTMIYRIGIPAFLMGISGGVYLIAQRKRSGLFIASCAFAPIILLIAASPFVFTVDRYIFITLPFLMILAAAAVLALFSGVRDHSRWLVIGVLGMVLAMPLSEDLLYYQYYRGSRLDWERASRLVQQKAQPDDYIYSTQPNVSRYYFSGEVGYISHIDPEKNGLEDARVWFLIDNEIGWVEPDLYEWILEKSQLVDVVDLPLPGRTLSISIYLKDPANQSAFR